jgi:transcription initiation factor IIE alpha subunit
MDDQESLLKEVRALREYLQRRDAENRKTMMFVCSVVTGLGMLFLVAHLLGF